MALTNNIIAGADPDINYGAYTDPGRGFEFKSIVTLADITALGAFLTGDVIIMNLPKRGYIVRTAIKHTTAVAGPSISACTVQITDGTNNYSAAFDVFQAVANTAAARDQFVTTTAAGLKGLDASFTVQTPVKLHFIAVGANLGVATAGQIEVTITYSVLP